MLKKFSIVFIAVFCWLSGALQAQELNCRVTINDSQVQASDRTIFREMEEAFTEFLNERDWTPEEFGYNEQIDCNVQITITEQNQIGDYSATFYIQAARPVYGSSYITPTFVFNDRDFNFQYVASQPLDFSPTSFNSNLSSMLGFYAYMVLGMDFDSFAPLGGTPFFEQARNIAQIAQQEGLPGWDPAAGGNASRNRGALINNVLSPQGLPLREMMYTYHRLALDTFIESPEESRKLVLEGLKTLQEVREYNPGAIALIAFFDAKSDELTKMFTKGDISVRREAFDLLRSMDPSEVEKYSLIIE
ncbi:type IX secretion system protein PorD [Nafulsella turpanensis]|uniref:type IX secretion system protein PorD n=1 Tax=Nafulsella turpanensis TaxID=1265690 RepID=UPI00034D8A6D|nr:DUF4835 family protein [Nafulsella turpanensis]